MDMNEKKVMHPAWITLIIFVLTQAVIVSAFAWTNNTKTNRNEKDIQRIMDDSKEFQEKIYHELTEIRKEINK